jgi:predicted DNA-binding ribbon-helix-helix protein
MNKNINFNEETARLIQQYADRFTNGNFTAAVNVICALFLTTEEKQNEKK